MCIRDRLICAYQLREVLKDFYVLTMANLAHILRLYVATLDTLQPLRDKPLSVLPAVYDDVVVVMIMTIGAKGALCLAYAIRLMRSPIVCLGNQPPSTTKLFDAVFQLLCGDCRACERDEVGVTHLVELRCVPTDELCYSNGLTRWTPSVFAVLRSQSFLGRHKHRSTIHRVSVALPYGGMLVLIVQMAREVVPEVFLSGHLLISKLLLSCFFCATFAGRKSVAFIHPATELKV